MKKRALCLLLAASLWGLAGCQNVRTVPQPQNTGLRAQPPLTEVLPGGGYPLVLGGVELDPPFSYASLLEKGFAPATAPSEVLAPESLSETVTVSGHGATFDVYLYNAGMDMQPAADCMVVWLDVTGQEAFSLPEGFVMGASMDEILLQYGDSEESFEDSGRDVLSYGTGLYQGLNLHFSRDSFTLERVESYNLPSLTQDWEETGAARVVAALRYQPPAALGSDLTSGIFQLDGDLYRLPAPVSAFVANGWEAVRFEGSDPDSRSVVAGDGVRSLTLTRGGKALTLLCENVSHNGAALEDCFVFTLTTGLSQEEGFVVLPGGVTTGMSVQALAADGPKALQYDGFSYNAYSEDERRWVMLSASTGKQPVVETISLLAEDESLWEGAEAE